MAKKSAKEMQKDLQESANRIWLAGLGALATVGEEGGKLFDTLVKKGEGFEPKVKARLDKAKGKFTEAKGKADTAWDKVGSGFDEKITSALHRVGVPTRDEIKDLSKRVAELTAKVEQLRNPGSGK
ncbi:MAG: phasin family protein [Acidobacteriota bacterium]